MIVSAYDSDMWILALGGRKRADGAPVLTVRMYSFHTYFCALKLKTVDANQTIRVIRDLCDTTNGIYDVKNSVMTAAPIT